MRAAILGTAGYSGQETLDRVLAHPGLELVALGSESLAGQPAAALDPRLARNGASAAPAFVTNDEACERRRCRLPLSRPEEAARIEPPPRASSTSPAARLASAAAYEEWYGFRASRSRRAVD
jgi:N-acetyl-gamma-glutamylphosphate reductase